MNRIIDNFSVGKFRILVMDSGIPNTKFSAVKIDNDVHKVTVPYDIPNSIAIESDKDYANKAVEFI